MTKADMHARGTGGDDIADLDIAIGDNDPVNEQFNHLTALNEGRLGQALQDLSPMTASVTATHNKPGWTESNRDEP
jgi:hypothetical protein